MLPIVTNQNSCFIFIHILPTVQLEADTLLGTTRNACSSIDHIDNLLFSVSVSRWMHMASFLPHGFLRQKKKEGKHYGQIVR